MVSSDKFKGCLIGLGLGDALCAASEGGIAERFLWKLIGKTKEGLYRYTDDTHMTMMVAKHLVMNATLDQGKLAEEFATGMKWSRGYGPSTVYVLKKIKKGVNWKTASTMKYPEGSFGNGAAMRIAPAALLYHKRLTELPRVVTLVSEITHPNKMAITGALLIAIAVIYGLDGKGPFKVVDEMIGACGSDDYALKLGNVKKMLSMGSMPEPRELSHTLGTGMAAIDSCPTAILIGLHFSTKPFYELIRYVNRCKGDTDTIAAMAGAIWGAYNGLEAIPKGMVESLEDYKALIELADKLYEKANTRGSFH